MNTTTHRQPSILLSLPEEVITSIIFYISESSLVELSRTCRKLYRLCSSPLEIRQRCLTRRWWDRRHNFTAMVNCKDIHKVNWLKLYIHRMNVERTTTRLLDEIIANPTNHINNFNRIVDFGYDAKDTLARHAQVEDDQVDDPLARRYQASIALQYLHRRRALQIWQDLRSGVDVPLEVALLAFDLFVMTGDSPDVEEIVVDFDLLARLFLFQTPEFYLLETSEKTLALITFLWEQGFKACPLGKYRAMKNQFIGLTMRTVRTAIPLTLVGIFCAVARRVGMKAYPCGFPNHMLAIVEAEGNEAVSVAGGAASASGKSNPSNVNSAAANYQYYDLFCSPNRHPRLDKQRLLDDLSSHDPALIPSLLSPSPTINIVLRQARNIINTCQLTSRAEADIINICYPRINHTYALYSAIAAHVILKPGYSHNYVTQLSEICNSHLPMDVRFLEEEILPTVPEGREKGMLTNVVGALRAQDEMPRAVARREGEGVRYKVGMVLRHARYGYLGAVFGWTQECKQGEDWVQVMGVDGLNRGRRQPFYHVVVEDGSVRYLAEENIRPIKPQLQNVQPLMHLAGKYFKRFDKETGMFVSNMQAEFPDD
ncbi:hypothetical protein BZA77DRAFT_284357 [Pyronema omphalodes]|nr:hypothetical protein BZA77DRAFT_284357 [Pyronema omphalodes]